MKKVILLSTDKAVYPINAMGMSKAIAEKVMVAAARNTSEKETIFCATRYGNVMASRGSVIPLFIEQIKKGKNLSITDPNMTRYLMSLEESVDLVLYAFNHGKQGDMFVQKAPASTINDLAIALKEMFNSNVEIDIIGTRHGEKVYETLISKEEFVKAEDLGQYYRIPADNRDLNYEKYFSEGDQAIEKNKEYNSNNTLRLDINGIKKILYKLPFVQQELTVLDNSRD